VRERVEYTLAARRRAQYKVYWYPYLSGVYWYPYLSISSILAIAIDRDTSNTKYVSLSFWSILVSPQYKVRIPIFLEYTGIPIFLSRVYSLSLSFYLYILRVYLYILLLRAGAHDSDYTRYRSLSISSLHAIFRRDTSLSISSIR